MGNSSANASASFTRLVGTGSFLPELSVSNHELFRRPGIQANFAVERARSSLKQVEDPGRLTPEEVFDAWAIQLTGIRARRVVGPDGMPTTEEMLAEAGRRALERAGLGPGAVDVIVVATLTPRDVVPNAACTISHLLGIPRTGGFTLNGACTGFIHALAAAQGFLATGVARCALVLAGDTLSRITNYSDPTTAVLFSDGAAAAVLVAGPEPGILGPPFLSGEYEREHLFQIGQGWEEPGEPSPKLRMGGGPRVLRRAILAMEEAATRALESAGVGWDSVDLVVPHQANLRITRGLETQLDLRRGRVVHTIEDYGNCSAATVGIALDRTLRDEANGLPDPARIVLTAVGGGYTTAGLVMDVAVQAEAGEHGWEAADAGPPEGGSGG